MGKALQEGYLFEAFFTSSFYKHMCGMNLSMADMEDFDPEFFKNLQWIMENDVEVLDLNFSYDIDNFGQTTNKELVEGGAKIAVTNKNKQDYVHKICYAKMAVEIKDQVEAFLYGLHDLVPPSLLALFTHRELELMISGLPDIDCKIPNFNFFSE